MDFKRLSVFRISAGPRRLDETYAGLLSDFMSSEAARIDHWDYKLEAWSVFFVLRDSKSFSTNIVTDLIVKLERAKRFWLFHLRIIDVFTSLAGSSLSILIELHAPML